MIDDFTDIWWLMVFDDCWLVFTTHQFDDCLMVFTGIYQSLDNGMKYVIVLSYYKTTRD
jgi:hypothetical protein